MLAELNAADKVNAATDRFMGVFRSEYSDYIGEDDDDAASPTMQGSPSAASGAA